MPVRISDIWVANQSSGTVSKLDASNNYAKTDYDIVGSPWGVAVDHLGNIWVTDGGSNQVVKLDASNNYSRTGYPVAGWPVGVAVDQSGNIWVANYDNSTVSKLDASNNYKKTDIYLVMGSPWGIAVDLLGNIWVANYDSNTVSKLDASNNYEKTDYTVGSTPTGVAVDQSGSIWVTNYSSNTVSKLSALNSYAKTDYTVGSGPYGVAVDQLGNIWLSNRNSNTVSKLNALNSYVKTDYTVGTKPGGVAVDQLGNIWVANTTSHTVSKLDASNNYAKTDYTVGSWPYSLGDMTGQIPYILNFGGVWEESPGTPQSIQADTQRITGRMSVQVDTIRRLVSIVGQTLQADTKRIIGKISFQADSTRKRAGLPPNIETVSIDMQAGTLMDDYSISTYDDYDIGNNILGQIKDRLFRFAVEKTIPDSDGKTTISGVYDVDEILNKSLSFNPSTNNASDIMAAMASAMGKNLVIYTADHVAVSMSESKPTPKDVISNLYDWTAKIPHQRVNVFLRMGTIYVIQRGHEIGVGDIVNLDGPRKPTRQKLRTLQSESDTDGNSVSGQITGNSTTTTYLIGTFSHGGDSYTYSNGLVTSESHTVNGQTTTTSYNYSSNKPPAYITGKTVTESDGSQIITSYEYNDEYLIRETETRYDQTHSIEETRVTIYTPKGQGFWSVDVYIDGDLTASNLQNGSPPSGIASVQSIVSYSVSGGGNSVTTAGRYIGDSYFPVDDTTTLNRIAAQLEWLDGRIEESISIIVYDESILDFTHRYRLNGVEWYLESNKITQTPTSFEQRVELVRYV